MQLGLGDKALIGSYGLVRMDTINKKQDKEYEWQKANNKKTNDTSSDDKSATEGDNS